MRETQAWQEAMLAHADAVVQIQPWHGSRRFHPGARNPAEVRVYFPEEIRRLGALQVPPLLPLVEELTGAAEVVAAVARGITNAAIATSLGISVETVKTHVVNAKDKLGAGDRTQLAVMALLYGLIDPLG